MLPKDHDDRRTALTLLLEGLEAEGFGKNTYGTAFWKDVKERFDASLEQATGTDSGVSRTTGNKNKLKKGLRKGLTVIVLAIRANYPDTWKTELRNWGFQKEKY